MTARWILLLLRLVHIVAGVLWVGAIVTLVAFLVPGARREGGDRRSLRRLLREQPFVRYLNVTLGLAILSGLILYGNLAWLTRGAWARSRMGIALGVGAAAALVAAVLANVLAAPAVHRAFALEDQARDLQGGAAEEARAAAAREHERYARTMRLVAALLLLTAATMAIGRYLG